MDRHHPDIVGNQTTFIRSMVKPCLEALSASSFIIGKNSIVKQQLEENLLTWEHTRITNDGELCAPDIEEMRRLFNQNRIEESSQNTDRHEIHSLIGTADTFYLINVKFALRSTSKTLHLKT